MNHLFKLLYIIDGLRAGGKERQLIEIIKYIPKSYYKLGVITFNKNQHYTELVKNNVEYFIELKKRPTRLEPFFTMWKFFTQFRPDIVHSWDSISSLYSYLPAKFYSAPIINGSIRDAGTDKGWEFYLNKFFLERAQIVIANSLAGLNYYGIKGHVIYNIIDMNRFDSQVIKNEFNLIMVANFTAFKDHETFISAAIKLLNKKIVDYVFLVGDGPHRIKYLNILKTNHNNIFNRFIFTGVVHNVEDYLSKCQVGVLCSTSKYGEGISNSVLEYMAAGLVPIATNIGGMPEIIDDGSNGFLIDENDSNKIVELVEKVKRDKELFLKITSNAKNTISAKFSYQKNIEKLLTIYAQLCGQK